MKKMSWVIEECFAEINRRRAYFFSIPSLFALHFGGDSSQRTIGRWESRIIVEKTGWSWVNGLFEEVLGVFFYFIVVSRVLKFVIYLIYSKPEFWFYRLTL